MNNNLYGRVSDELLPFVRQPAQYIGAEWNQLARPGDWERADVRVAVAFPDAYTIGMSHLGCQILYWLCNHTPGVCAERTYAPWIDAERVLRDRGLPLFTWDTRQPVADADILAISLQYELCFTTVLNVLDLAGIPLLREQRWNSRRADGRDWPLVLAGGPQADNPEPMADFIDLFVIGDGEASMAAILSAYRERRAAGQSVSEIVEALAVQFPWAYAPSLYDVAYHPDGTIARRIPRRADAPEHVARCQTPDFGQAPFPRRPLVPWVEVVHDRIAIEIMRGCPQVCRFCHAGYTKRPLHYRSPEEIVQIAEDAYWATGQKELGLLSLSTADYPLLAPLAAQLNERFAPRKVNLSFPSLRVDKMLQHIPAMGNSVRKGGITMAVEAARDDMRAAIRKKVTDGNLLDGVREVYKAGWNRIKLYFMSGFPGEREDDIDAIWELANKVSIERRALGRGPAHVTASVGWLVPKPFTPLQWMAQPRVDYYRDVQNRLRGLSGRGRRAAFVVSGSYGSADEMASERELHRGGARGRRGNVTVKTHDPQRSILEAVFARGDRRLGPVILDAWRRGARFDGWDETYRDEIWRDAFAATGVDPDWYAHRERSFDEVLPWEFIGLHMRRSYLENAFEDVFDKIGRERPPVRPRSTALPVVGSAGV